MYELTILLFGVIYGILVGLAPGIGATTGLIFLFSFITYFDPYHAVMFCMAVVAASTTFDTITSVMLGIPGANSSAATIVNGFPLAVKGRAISTISAAVTTSTINGLIWGGLTFIFLPYYTDIVLYFGIPHLWGLTIFAFALVIFISKDWKKSIISLAFGIILGLVGVDPNTNVNRFTLGWDYLADGIQLLPLVAGLFAVPELIQRTKNVRVVKKYKQMSLGIRYVFRNKLLALQGGFIGAIVGILPGIGGAAADWIAYSLAPKHGIKNVIGIEGANNSQKATSMIPTVLFGIPGAPFAAILMGLFSYINFEVGTLDLLSDKQFFNNMLYGFMGGSVIAAIMCFALMSNIIHITRIPYKYYAPLIFSIIVFACVQYTGGWEDYIILFIFSLLGIIIKKYDFNAPALLFGFILSERIEALTIQMGVLYL
jgi:TctA family transporter